jgi:hypothetical protein
MSEFVNHLSVLLVALPACSHMFMRLDSRLNHVILQCPLLS